MALKDEYEITLQADYEVYVPMPVVVVVPAELEWAVLQSGLVKNVQFVVTNYGLISANGVKFILPSTDPQATVNFYIVSIKGTCTISVIFFKTLQEICCKIQELTSIVNSDFMRFDGLLTDYVIIGNNNTFCL